MISTLGFHIFDAYFVPRRPRQDIAKMPVDFRGFHMTSSGQGDVSLQVKIFARICFPLGGRRHKRLLTRTGAQSTRVFSFSLHHLNAVTSTNGSCRLQKNSKRRAEKRSAFGHFGQRRSPVSSGSSLP